VNAAKKAAIQRVIAQRYAVHDKKRAIHSDRLTLRAEIGYSEQARGGGQA
jgi:hypothetical protein